MTLTLPYILTQYRNTSAYHLKDRAKFCVSVLHIRMHMAFIDIRRKFLPNEYYLKSSNCNYLKTASRNLIFVNAISIVFEISGITVKWYVKWLLMIITDFYEFLNHIFLEKRNRACSARVSSYHVTHELTQNSRHCSDDLMIYNEKKLILLTESLIIF